MKIVYQGKAIEIGGGTLSGFLVERSIPAESVVLELNGEVCNERDWEIRALREGDVLNIFRIVAGG